MAIKDLAVAYNGGGNADAAVDLGLQMCRKYQASLTGIYAATPIRFEGQVSRWVSDDVIETLRNAESAVARQIEEAFRRRVQSDPPPGGTDFIAEEGQANAVLARQARFHDLLLVGQFTVSGDAGRPIRAEDLVLRTGRPLLIVPHSYAVRPFQEYAVVAWDGSRQAARALSDAMQILETKKRLDIVTVRASGSEAPKTPSAIAKHLSRHGIDAREVTLTASREGIGRTILDHCSQNGPDILVVGAYGHTKLREDLFGGVTRQIMENMTVPVLMSH